MNGAIRCLTATLVPLALPAAAGEPWPFPWPQSRIAHYTAHRAAGPIAIDGRLDEADWKAAPRSPRFSDLVRGAPGIHDTRAAVLWDDQQLYVGYWLEEPFVEGTLTERDSLIYKNNDVELFIAGQDAYYELEVNCLGTIYEVFFIWEAAYEQAGYAKLPEFDRGRQGVRPFGGVGFKNHPRGPRIGYWGWDLPGLKSAVHVDGTVNDNSDRDRGWSVELSIPWQGLAQLALPDGRSLPPKDGDVWRMDFSRFNQYKEAPPAQDPGGWAWSPHGAWDSHIPELFPYIHFSVHPASLGNREMRPPIPVILDTDIGDDIDDTWALILALKSPELDVKLVVTDFGNTEHRAKIVARLLEIAERTDIPIGIGIQENDAEGPQSEWVKGYDLSKYPGRILKDGVQALIDTAMNSREPVTLVAIGPPPNLKAALEREPRIAGKLRLAGMYGSLRRGYGGKPKPEPEWNVRASLAAARALLAAPWAEAISTPLDTCGLVRLKGERYARVRDSKDPLLRALIENYRLWCPRRDWCAKDAEYVSSKSSTLFDTVAVYLAISRELVRTEDLGVRVTDDGLTVPDPAARPLTWATEWRDLDAFEEWLVARLTAPRAVARR